MAVLFGGCGRMACAVILWMIGARETVQRREEVGGAG